MRSRRPPRPGSTLRGLAGVLAFVLSAGAARAADVTVLRTANGWAAQSQTLRIPRTGSFTMDGSASSYLVVGVAVPDTSWGVGSAIWTTTTTRSTSQALTIQVSRSSEGSGGVCRSELWALARPVAGQGFVTVTLKTLAGSPAPTSIIGTIISFDNVRATSIGGGPCCADAANSGAGTSIISKTMDGTSRGDALVNSVCTAWSGATPGMPTPDPAADPEMVPRTFMVMSSPNLQHFTGTSPGGDAQRPATKYRHLRWLQSGSRTWAIVGLELFATLDPPDAAPPPPPPPPPPPDAGAPAADAAPPADGAPPADERVSLPEPPPPRLDGNLTAAPDPDTLADEGPLAADAAVAGPRDVELQVGCACRVGARGGAGGLLVTLPIVAVLARRRRVRVPQRPC